MDRQDSLNEKAAAYVYAESPPRGEASLFRSAVIEIMGDSEGVLIMRDDGGYEYLRRLRYVADESVFGATHE